MGSISTLKSRRSELGCTDVLQTPKFLELDLVLAIHHDQLQSYGGEPGLRDGGLLESALSQPQASMFGQLLHSTLFEQAAAYLYYIALNHPFIDGNKRTSAACTEIFLLQNSYELTLSENEFYSLVLGVVNKEISKEELARLLESASIPALQDQTPSSKE